MKHKQLVTGLLTLAILLCTQMHVWALNNNLPVAQEDVILQWNRVLQETIRTPGLRFVAQMRMAMRTRLPIRRGLH